MQKPLLSIGMIFKNEIRCLERCLKSLQPLRETIPCELVMADTGSSDGSREVAERYADILFDFPWIDDFAAARNAVIDRCSGEWFMTIDADEWLCEDFSGLTSFLRTNKDKDYVSLKIRNYKSPELENGGRYADFAAGRIFRMSSGARYTGAIHEHWATENITLHLINGTFFHHDGYVYADADTARRKAERNLALIKSQLKENPDDLLLMMQYIESDTGESPEYIDYVYKSVQGVKEKRKRWKMFGPSTLRHAVTAAMVKKLPELEEWVALAEEMFPSSIFTRVDIQYIAMGNCWNKGEYEETARRGEEYLRGIHDYLTGNFDQMDAVSSPLGMGSAFWVQSAKLFLAAAYLMLRQPEKCADFMKDLDVSIMDTEQVRDCVRDLIHLHSWSEWDTDQLTVDIWEAVNCPIPSQEKASQRRKDFLAIADDVFHPVYQNLELEDEKYHRPGYTTFLPLLSKENCELGTAAAILETSDLEQLEELLNSVEKWDEVPAHALEHALLGGVRFPLPGKPLAIEKMDAFAARMARQDGPLPTLTIRAADGELADWQSLVWARGLALAAVQSYDWTDGGGGMELCRAFADIEETFLRRYYAQELLCDENIRVLPPMHRFGWYCAQAFQALDTGDDTGYVRLLRQGLDVCHEAKSVVEFLLKHLKEKQQTPASPELLMLAEQVRTLLAQYPADDPAVAALKQSEAYQKVVHLIEGPELGVFGGFRQ